MSNENKSMSSFADWTDEEVQDFLAENEFLAFRKLETGEWIGLYRLAFTLSVCMDISPISQFAYRWCFENSDEAIYFFGNATEFDEVPTKRSSLRGHRYTTKPLLIEHDELGYPKW